ncbi:MAG: hypothetical protein M3179_06170 [Actinomycetota bacterium]|nr:hypothetical protein [Actinomycetota bacterium]
MTVLTMVIEATAFLVVVLLVLSVVGFAILEWASPEMHGLQWLLSPVVGLAVLYLACQWLSPWLPSSVVVVGVVIAGTVLSAVALWRRRPLSRGVFALRRFDVIAPGLVSVATYLALLAHQFKLGFFTTAGTGLDALFIYLPAGEFMRAHAYAAGQTPPVVTPAISTLEADFYPGSLGTVDGGLAALLRRPVFELLEPLNAVSMVLALVGVYVLVVAALRLSRLTGLVAVVLVATSQFLLWAAGFDFVQQIRASAMLPGVLALTLYAFEQSRLGAAVVAGAVAAAMVPVYMPVFLIFVAAVAGGAAVAAVVGLVRRQWPVPPAALAGFAGAGIVAGLPTLHWLLFDGGLDAWNLVSQDKFGPYAAGGMLATHYSPAELLGTSSLADTYRLKPLLFWNDGLTVLGGIAAAVGVGVGILGLVMLVRAGRWLWPAMAAGVFLYVAYVRYGPTNLYGFVKTVSYALPVTSTVVAVGLTTLAGWRWPGRPRTSRFAGSSAVVAVVGGVLIVGMQLSAAVETEHLFLQLDPTISKAQSNLRHLDEVVPVGDSVLIQDPGPLIPGTPLTPNSNLTHVAAYFLSNRDVTLATPLRPDPPGDYDYRLVLSGSPAPAGYRPVWSDETLGVALYERGA